jgi:hypothetical protein
VLRDIRLDDVYQQKFIRGIAYALMRFDTPKISAGEARSARHAWVLGCAQSVSKRLMATVREREVRASGNGPELVPIDKPALLQAELDARGLKFSKAHAVTMSDGASYGAGAEHGDGASIGRPIKDGRVAGLLEHKRTAS